ncbi:MAG: hypothetical protein KDK66_07295 [Deltaproteobacteria bacterium]|nr:hypothetical protein [Deltaproteobacteria bacterium]
MLIESQTKIGLLRAACLWLPVIFAILLAFYGPQTKGKTQEDLIRHWAASGLAFLWCLIGLFAFHLLLPVEKWWSYDAKGGLFYGLPVDLILDWSVLWSFLPFWLFPRLPLGFLVLIFALLDFAAMPLLKPLVQLKENWWQGEVFALILIFIPAQVLARLTKTQSKLALRIGLQFLLFCQLSLFLLPALVFSQSKFASFYLPHYPLWLHLVFLGLLFFLSLPALSGVQEFYRRGQGTPFPWDPPKSLVTSGVYAYLQHPMQLFITLIYLLAAIYYQNFWWLIGALLIASFALGLAHFSEVNHLKKRFGSDYEAYQKSSWGWLPCLRPQKNSAQAKLLLGKTAKGWEKKFFSFLSHQKISHLSLEEGPQPGLTYQDTRDSYQAKGLLALAEACNHLHLAWAYLSWLLKIFLFKKG